MEVDALAAPFADGGAGENLRYEPVYDQIKEARVEEDATLSRGVWERELKKADWGEVQRLCTEALLKRSKDLQLVAWLGEAACHLDQWSGFLESLELMTVFCQKCWEHSYPAEDDGTPDLDFRVRILEWFVERMEERLLFLPLTKSTTLMEQPLDLATWMEAQNRDSVSRRMGSQTPAEDADGIISLNRYRTLIRQAETDALQNDQAYLARAFDWLKKLDEVWTSRCQGQEPSLGHLKDSLRSIEKLCQFALEGRVVQPRETVVDPRPMAQEEAAEALFREAYKAEGTPDERGENLQNSSIQMAETDEKSTNVAERAVEEADEDATTITDRKGAYQAVNDLADYLIQLDPQTPGPYLIKMVASWDGRSLPDVLDDVANGNSEGHRVLRMMAGVLQSIQERKGEGR